MRKTIEARTAQGNRLVIVAQTERDYFSVTATEYERGRDVCGGCMHDEVLVARPDLAPLIALHLSNATTGEPMHAEANGWYWLAGATGGQQQEHHGANGSSPMSENECASIFARHTRAGRHEVDALAYSIRVESLARGPKAARMVFGVWLDAQRPRWAREAEEGRALLAAL
jgi:hypothetical protein